jgi:chromosome segregation protein
LAPLAEQARRARDYLGARAELRRRLRAWYTWQWADTEAARARASAAEAETAAHIEAIRASLQSDDAQLQEIRLRREELVSQIAALRRMRGEASGHAQKIERDLAVGEERQASLERQAADFDGEQGMQEAGLATARQQHTLLEEQLDAADQRSEQLARESESAESAQHRARQEQEQEEARLRGAQREVIQAQALAGATQAELVRLRKQRDERTQALTARQEAEQTARQRLDAASATRAQREATFEEARGRVADLVAQREVLGRELAAGLAETETWRAALADAERERRALTDRMALLTEWQQHLDGFSDGVRAVMRAPVAERPPVVDVLARLVRVQAGYEAAIEGALGHWLHALVAGSEDDALACARWLRARGAGHALLLWPTGGDASDDGISTHVGANSILGPARAFVETDPTLRPLIERLLDGTIIVRDLDAARHLLEAPGGSANPGSAHPRALVTPAGEVLHRDAWLRGGAAYQPSAASGEPTPSGTRAGTLLEREREVREVPDQIARQDTTIAAAKEQYEQTTRDQAARQAAIAECERAARDAEARAQELAREVTALQRDEERARGERQASETVAGQLAAEVDALNQEVTAAVARVAEGEARQRDAQEAAGEMQDAVDALVSTNSEQQEALARQRTALAVHQQEAKALAQRLEQLRAQTRELEQQIDRRGERMRSIEEQRNALDDASEHQREALEDVRGQLRGFALELGERESELAHAEGTLAQVDREQALARQELATIETEYRRRMVEAQRARDAVDALATQIRDELIELDELSAESTVEDVAKLFGGSEQPSNTAVAPLDADTEATSATSVPTEEQLNPDEAARTRRQIDQLRGRLRQLGGYDPSAPQEYEELKTRHEFLSGQVRDMEQGAANLRAIIAELDTTMRRQFAETFAAVNLRFQRHFTTLFSGGSARLELTAPRRQSAEDDEEDEESGAPTPSAKAPSFGGVEVFVQIPGKRVQDLALLSGGERAMVSAALLFALLETNPPPFCLLDEVDAALDEANVVRFCEILKQLAASTQFIVITHNRVTMTHAGAIYGVSMGSDSVSRVLSMRLADVPVTR